MTNSQTARIAGFNTQLAQRGIAVALQGGAVTFTVLREDLGRDELAFEVSQDKGMFSHLHLLRVTPGADAIVFGSVLVEAESGRRHTVVDRLPHEIKLVFKTKTAEA